MCSLTSLIRQSGSSGVTETARLLALANGTAWLPDGMQRLCAAFVLGEHSGGSLEGRDCTGDACAIAVATRPKGAPLTGLPLEGYTTGELMRLRSRR